MSVMEKLAKEIDESHDIQHRGACLCDHVGLPGEGWLRGEVPVCAGSSRRHRGGVLAMVRGMSLFVQGGAKALWSVSWRLPSMLSLVRANTEDEALRPC